MRLAREYQVNPDFKKQLAAAFGLGSELEFDSLVAKLRAGGPVDPETLRKGTLALVDNMRETQAAHVDARVKVALKASNLALWEWDLTTGNIFVDRTYFGFLGLDRDCSRCPSRSCRRSYRPKT